MLVTRHTDYSLRLLMYAAIHDDRLVTIAEVATAYGISRNHLMKIVQNLARHGYVETIRGKGGGLRLARPAGDISLGDLLRDTETSLEVVNCRKPECPLSGFCNLKRTLDEARDAFVATLRRYTVADMVANRSALLGLLHDPPARNRTKAGCDPCGANPPAGL